MPLTSIPSGGPVLQAPLENGAMSGFPIKGCAFSKWVREIFATSPDSLGLGITGHSAKCTTLSWMSKLNCSELSRCILGHHVPKCSSAVLTYSRDEQSGPLRELASAYADIRSGRFVPDATRSGMLCDPVPPPEPVAASAVEWYAAVRENISERDIDDLLQDAQVSVCEGAVEPPRSPTAGSQALESFSVVGDENEALQSEPESSSDSSSSSSSDSSDSIGLDEALEECAESSLQEPDVPDPLCTTYQHVRTNTLHLLPNGSSSGRFVCGRPLNSSDHKSFASKIMVDAWWCRQCKNGRPIRDCGALNAVLDSAVKRIRTV